MVTSKICVALVRNQTQKVRPLELLLGRLTRIVFTVKIFTGVMKAPWGAKKVYHFFLHCICLFQSVFLVGNLINIFTRSQSWSRQHPGQTIHCTEKLICSKFFVLWHGHDYFWPPWLWRLLKTKKCHSKCTFWHSNLMFGSSQSSHSIISKVLESRNFENSGYKLCSYLLCWDLEGTKFSLGKWH